MEQWKSVKNYEGLYEVSSFGRLRSINRPKPFILNPQIRSGYLQFLLSKNAQKSVIRTHRLVAETFIPNPENKPIVNHINGVKTDNRVENLEWVTHAENMKHASKNGLMIKKLTDKEVEEIRSTYSWHTGTLGEFAKKYGVSKNYIWRIVNRNRRA